MKPAFSKYIFPVILSCIASFSYGQQQRAVPDSVVQQMKNDEAFKYANDPSFWAKEEPSADPAFFRILARILGSDIVKWIIYLLVFAVLAYVIYKIIVQNNLFAPTRRKRKSKEDGESETDIPANIDERLAAAITAKEYRLAVRFYFLKTLQLLASKDKIKLHAKATNYDYISQMRDDADGNDFRRLTSIYEYVWYGEFLPDAPLFERISAGFNQFNERI